MKVLVISETDASCGPMAAAFLRDYSTTLEVVSVGRNPSQSVDSMVVEVMKESLIDLKDYMPRDGTTVDADSFDAVYECPERPCSRTLEAYRNWRDEIKNAVFLFFLNLNGKGQPSV